jgi:hypothetical protein
MSEFRVSHRPCGPNVCQITSGNVGYLFGPAAHNRHLNMFCHRYYGTRAAASRLPHQ